MGTDVAKLLDETLRDSLKVYEAENNRLVEKSNQMVEFYNRAITERNALESQLTAAQKRLEIAEAALMEYADEDNWHCADDEQCDHNDCDLTAFYGHTINIRHGYNIAQTALREMEGEGK